MKLIKFVPLMFILVLYSTSAFSETKKECASISEADTGVKMYENWKCKMGNEDSEGFAKKLKKLFKKKN